jgi:alpha-L-arabinofuranosidase
VNRDSENPVDVSIEGIARRGDAEIFTVSGDDTLATNAADNPNRVRIESAIWQNGTLTLPPHSFTMLIVNI